MLERAKEWWDGRGRFNQIMIVTGLLGAIGILVGFIAWASTPEYAPLFSGLSAQDANTITDKLREANVPYRLSQGGASVEVPVQNRDEMRMKLASQNLPQQSSATLGYELLEKGGSLSDTQPREAMTLLRVREGEISKSIMSLQQVASATVHIAAPEDTVFVASPGDKKDSSAAINITLKPGQSLSDENVRAIVRLTQMAYSGLAEKNISLVDSSGQLLFDGAHLGGADGGERVKQARQLAQEQELKLQSLLDRTLGPHKAVVSVSAELSADTTDVNATSYEPGAVINKTSETEELSGAGSVPKGAAGANANLPLGGAPTYQSATTGDANSHFKHETASTTTQPSVTVTHTTKTPGRIEKLTVSALVDAKVPADEVASIKQVLETAIAVDPSDTTHSRVVTVAQLPFDAPKVDPSAGPADGKSKLIATAAPLAMMLICFILLARSLRRPTTFGARGGHLALAGAGGGSQMAIAGGGPIQFDAQGAVIPGQTVGEALGDHEPIGLTHSGGPRTFNVIEQAFDANMESILYLTRTKPETVAALVKSWIAEEE